MSGKVHVMDHPLVAHKLTILRDKNTSVKDFREIVSEIGMLITYEATRDLPLTTKEVETPICKTIAPTLKGKKFAVVPILRAGLGLVDGVLRMVPSARVGHIGMFRDEETLEPHVYFCKMPKDIEERDIMIVDPMLATGGSADAAAVLAGLNRLYKTGISKTELCEIAVKIGADVPFLIAGGTARARGIGEKLTPLMPLKDCWFLLAKAEEKPSTAEMFSRLDSTDYIKPDIEKTVNAVNCGDLNGVLENLGNSFEILWSKSALKEMLSSTHPAACSLSGSGPARFAVYGDLNAALRARDKLSAKGVFCEICKPLNKSLIFE